MLGFARKLLYIAVSAIERHSDENYYFLGFECKINHIQEFDLLLKLFEKKPSGVERKFRRLIDIAAEMANLDPILFKLKATIFCICLFEGISAEGSEYILEKAYQRGMSLRDMRRCKKILV